MKVLHYIPTIGKSGGGVSSYLQLLSSDLGTMVELHIVCHKTNDELLLENCYIHYIEGNLIHPINMKKQFCKLLDELKPDIVHINGCWMLQCSLTIFWAKNKGYPVILSPHGMLEPWNIRKNYWTKKLPAILLYQKRSIKKCNILIATAEKEKINLQSLGYNKNIAVVPNGIIVNGIECKKTWKENKQILFLALYRKNKGIDILMQAISKIKEKIKDWKVIIAGIESDYTIEDLNKMATELEISNMVDVTGPLFGSEKWDTYKKSDVFILPTLNENFGIVIAESYLCGTPVITTKGAPWPIIKEKKCGWWIDRSVDNIAKSIEEFINTPIEKRKEMGITGREFVINNFASEKIAIKMVNIYKMIVNEKPY